METDEKWYSYSFGIFAIAWMTYTGIIMDANDFNSSVSNAKNIARRFHSCSFFYAAAAAAAAVVME